MGTNRFSRRNTLAFAIPLHREKIDFEHFCKQLTAKNGISHHPLQSVFNTN
jgi:hypothetical protein